MEFGLGFCRDGIESTKKKHSRRFSSEGALTFCTSPFFFSIVECHVMRCQNFRTISFILSARSPCSLFLVILFLLYEAQAIFESPTVHRTNLFAFRIRNFVLCLGDKFTSL